MGFYDLARHGQAKAQSDVPGSEEGSRSLLHSLRRKARHRYPGLQSGARADHCPLVSALSRTPIFGSAGLAWSALRSTSPGHV